MTPPPIIDTLTQMTVRDEYLAGVLRTERDNQPGWVSAAELMAPDTPHVDDILARVAAHHGAADRRAPAALWFGHHSFMLMAFPLAAYMLTQRVPHLRPAELWLRFDDQGEICA